MYSSFSFYSLFNLTHLDSISGFIIWLHHYFNPFPTRCLTDFDYLIIFLSWIYHICSYSTNFSYKGRKTKCGRLFLFNFSRADFRSFLYHSLARWIPHNRSMVPNAHGYTIVTVSLRNRHSV